MRCCVVILLVGLFSALWAFAQDQAASTGQDATAAFAVKAAVRAMNFEQGDLKGFTAARDDFTSDAWKELLKHMEGFLDENGAPTFTSSFVPSGKTRVLGQENGIVHLRIPGTLMQTAGKASRTTYSRFALDVKAGGNPVKITYIEQVTCLGASTACE